MFSLGGIAVFVLLALWATTREATSRSVAAESKSRVFVLPPTLKETPVDMVSDDFKRIVSLCGQPDTDDSTEYDSPRPPMVTRWITYSNEAVEIILYPIGKYGDPPPYKSWKVLGYVDPSTKIPMTRAEAEDRLAGRAR
jgi:hypothetical protein